MGKDPEPGRISDVSRIRSGMLYEAIRQGFGDPHLAQADPAMWAGMLGDIPLFAGLDRDVLEEIARAAQVAELAEGQEIAREGQPVFSLYLLLTGTATVSTSTGERTQITHGACVGELGLLDGQAATATATADRPMWVMKLSSGAFADILERHPSVSRALLRTLAGRIRALEMAARS
jgi:CRP/FNR family transcriptional regulator, cyclic AMP receptor protein